MSDTEHSTSDSDYFPPAGSEDEQSPNEYVDDEQHLEDELQAEGPDDPNNQRITSEGFTYVTSDDDEAPQPFPFIGAPVGPKFDHFGLSSSDIFKQLID